MKRKFGLIALVVVGVLLATTACGAAKETPTLYFYNWSEYIEPELYTEFEEEYGIKVVEDTFASNEDLFAKLQAGGGGYDVIVPSDYMVANMIENDMLAEIDHSKLTNFQHLDSLFLDPPYDPGLKYSIPYMWGTTGIGYNSAVVEGEVDSWAYLFDPAIASQYAGQISLLDDERETLGAALIYLGYDLNSTNEAELEEAKQLLLGVKDYIGVFDSETFEENLLSGDTVLAHGWSGDIFLAVDENEDIVYVIPKEGAVIWVDNLAIPKEVAEDEARMERALLWIDFLHRPENMARIVEFVYFATPNKDAFDLIDEEITGDPAIYPPDETYDRLTFIAPLGDATELYSRTWTEVIAGQ
jgi:spermidine/putrescine transport system substrate-binding protein